MVREKETVRQTEKQIDNEVEYRESRHKLNRHIESTKTRVERKQMLCKNMRYNCNIAIAVITIIVVVNLRL